MGIGSFICVIPQFSTGIYHYGQEIRDTCVLNGTGIFSFFSIIRILMEFSGVSWSLVELEEEMKDPPNLGQIYDQFANGWEK